MAKNILQGKPPPGRFGEKGLRSLKALAAIGVPRSARDLKNYLFFQTGFLFSMTARRPSCTSSRFMSSLR